jgi:hypothetical protein
MSAKLSSRRRIPAWLAWVALPVAIAGLAFAWWTISPLFISTRVEEAFPTAAPAAVVDTMAEPTAMGAAMGAAMSEPTAMGAAMSEPTAMAAPTAGMADTMGEPTAGMADAMGEPVAAEPVALASGSFTVIDSLHGAEGTATIYALADGQRVLRLEGFRAQNGPDLRIGLAGHAMPRSSAELHDTGVGYFELDRLKASEGSQNYAIPADLDLAGFESVVIYCRAFSVVFSTATLAG